MAHTPEQRSKQPLCGARRKNGDACRAFAGQGTDHPGVGRCKHHGGSTPTHKSNAVVVEAQRRMVQLGEPIPDLLPHQALLAVLRATAGHVAFLHREIAGLKNLAEHEARVMVTLYSSERDRLTRVAKACSEVGVSDREVALQQREAALFATAVDQACEKLGMASDKRRELHAAVAEALEASGDPDLDYLRAPGAIFEGRARAESI